MKTEFVAWSYAQLFALLLGVVLVGCKSKSDPNAGAPPPAVVVPDMDANNFKVDHPERFPLATAGEHKAAPELNVTGVVNPDIARTVPVISLATGKVVEIHARLGDVVKKGQLLLRVQSSDVAGAFSDYRKAVNDERLARVQLERSQILFDNGAIAKSALEVFEDAEQDAQVTLETATRTPAVARRGQGPSHRTGRHPCPGVGCDHRPAGDKRGGRARPGRPEPFHHF